MPEASDSPTVPSADAKTTADRLNDAFELLADGKREAAEQQVDILRDRWRERFGPSEEARRNWEVWLSDFEKLKKRPPSDIAEYVAARRRVHKIMGRVDRMQARTLPHGPTLAEAEKAFQSGMQIFRRALGCESYQSVECQLWLGYVHGCRRDWQAAEKSFEQALEFLAADFPDARQDTVATCQWLAWILMLQNKDFPRQTEYLESAITYAESRTDEEARYWPLRTKILLAEVTYRSGAREEADRMFAELRRQLPEDGGEGGKDSYVLWCQAWCDRHEARRLMAAKEHEEALAAVYAARKALADNGNKAELTAGLTIQELCCLAAEAVNGLGQNMPRRQYTGEYHPQAELPIANAIAEHAARLRGAPHEPLGLLPKGQESTSSRGGALVKTICWANTESILCFGTRITPEKGTSPADTKINVETCLRLGKFDEVRQWANQGRDRAEGVLGRDHVIVKASSEVLHVMDVIDGLPKEDQQAFCRTYSMLQGAIGKLRAAKQSAFASFAEINVAMDRLRVASEQFAAFPEPLNRFQANCDVGLAEAHVLLRNWSEAELLFNRICEGEGERDSMLFGCRFWARVPLSYVLLQQGKDEERIKELMEAQAEFIRVIKNFSFRGVKLEQVCMIKAEAAAAFGDRDEAERAYEELRSLVDEDDLREKYYLTFCDRHRAQCLLEDDDPVGACELIEDAYAKMIVHGKGSYCHGPEIEKTLRLRAEIYERLGRSDEAKADIAYADDIVRHTERVRGMCAADAEQRGKWANAKVDIPSLSTEESNDQECAKKETTGLEEWLRTGTGEYATGQSLFSKRR